MNDENIYTTPEDFDPDASFKRLLEYKVGDVIDAKTPLEGLIDLYRVVQMMGQAVHNLQIDFVQLLSQLVIEEQAQEAAPSELRLILPEGSQN